VNGVEGDKYMVGPACDAPGCKRPVDHKHHLWRRSFLGGDFWWVQVPGAKDSDPTIVIRNVVGLCWHHHEDVTGSKGGHKAWIKWVPETQSLLWMEDDGYDHWLQTGTLHLPTPSEEARPRMDREAERCPTCGKLKTKEHKDHEPQPKRARKSWTIKVPADHEDGAAILDELVEGCAEVFGHDEYTSALRRYYTVVQALTVVLQNRELIGAEIEAT
jgi:hypothetical protein